MLSRVCSYPNCAALAASAAPCRACRERYKPPPGTHRLRLPHPPHTPPQQALNGLISVLVFNIIYDLLLRWVQAGF